MHATVDWTSKGFWLPADGLADPALHAARPDLFTGPFTWPVMVAKRSVIEANVATMARYCARHGVDFAPHGKTTMAPALFAAQVEAGAWGITVATANQALAARRFGVARVLLANQVLDAKVLTWAAEQAGQGWTFLCYVDSLAGVEVLARALRDRAGGPDERADGPGERPGRLGERPGPLRVLVEVGYPGGRAGCRDIADAATVARAAAGVPGVEVAGVAGFEGMLPDQAAVDGFLDQMIATAAQIAPWCPGRLILSAGGSSYFDRVVAAFAPVAARHGWQVILRSGAVVSHDHGQYHRTTPFRREPDEGSLTAALEVWAQVLSTPEPGLAILGAGKRDLAFDLDLPTPLAVRRGGGQVPLVGASIDRLNDQHAYLRGADLAPGDLVSLGISHPCTAFDKWRVIPVVDDEYRVVDVLHTYF
ncbi:MAG TPA: alanine racemase [Micromonosporaceae bacterium]